HFHNSPLEKLFSLACALQKILHNTGYQININAD
ncbi:MAG: hypothetical protein ACI8YN_000645, partial [Porticoccaceae bacterium]